MGVFETYCALCAGPLCNARDAWLSFLEVEPNAEWPPKDGEWRNPPGYPVPSKSKEEIVRIGADDGQYWGEWVCVGPKWKGGCQWVSPLCEQGDYGAILIAGSDEWQQASDVGKYFRTHRGCLSFFCRRLDITPQTLWESFYAPDSDYLRFGEGGNGLFYCVKYYDMDGRNEQEFGYAVQKQTPHEDNPDIVGRWDDPATMEDTVWLLSQPRCPAYPAPISGTGPTEASSGPPGMRVFAVPELLDLVLSWLVGNDEYPLPDLSIHSVLAFYRVNRYLHDTIAIAHQNVFLRLAAQFGWMLPNTPGDWRDWERTELESARHDRDWRAFLIACLRKEDPAVKNRWRMHRMTVQFAHGRSRPKTATAAEWRWRVGKVKVPSALVAPEPFEWEL
ncbi:hypothetical protein HMN09_01293500 [Mycena chlorophos]|uniref:Uncharacterized protein n=1 Tax=Mycena chlorophos TaxID=658473 RepID=A0A8H6S189_MYCCL|nr:hypothetical protein HMN09_01293500 [Mycena chlorophos]